MGYFEYRSSQKLVLAANNEPGNAFYSLIMAAMREAGSDELHKLDVAFPGILAELHERYNSPGGFLPGERKEN